MNYQMSASVLDTVGAGHVAGLCGEQLCRETEDTDHIELSCMSHATIQCQSFSCESFKRKGSI